MREVYLVRHGETEWSRLGQHTSVTDLELTAVGVQQATSLLGHLDPSDFGLILSSPRRRAVQTAELAGFTGEHEPEICEDLVEWAYGDYEGRTSDDIQTEDPDWTIWSKPTPGGESAADVTARMDRLVARLQDSDAERAICFSHGHALRCLALRWLQFDLAYGVQFPLDTATVSVLGFEKDRPALLRWNARP